MMRTLTRVLNLIIVTAVVITADGAVLAETQESRATAALFEEFETVFRAAPAMLVHPHDNADNFARIPFTFLLAGLDALHKQSSTEIVDSTEAVLVGTKDYRAPRGLGPVRSTFCYVLVLKENNTLNFSRYFNTPTSNSSSQSSVWTWSGQLGEFGENDLRPTSFYATQVQRSFLLVTNDRDELQQCAQRLTSSDDGSSVLAGIREWNEVGRHTFWGYRRFRHGRVSDRLADGTMEVASTTEAMILFVNFKDNVGTLRLLSSKSGDAMANNINETKRMPPLVSSGERAWEATFPLVETKSMFPDAFLWVWWFFGRAVFV